MANAWLWLEWERTGKWRSISQTSSCHQSPTYFWDILSHCIPFLINLSCCIFPCAATIHLKTKKKGVVPTLTVGGGAPSAVLPGAQQGPAPRPALTDRSASTWACRSCSAALMTWHSSVTWAQRTLPRAFGWVWSSEAPRARTTAPWAADVTSPADRATAYWSGPAASPTGASTVHIWWMKTAKDCRNQRKLCDVLTFCLWSIQSKSFRFKLFCIAHYFSFI